MLNLLSRNRAVTPRAVTDPVERDHLVAMVRTTVLATVPGTPAFGTHPGFDERVLLAELNVERELRRGALAVVDDAGPIAARYGAGTGIVVVRNRQATLPTSTHDRFAGVTVANWNFLWCPPPAFRAPDLAAAPLAVPATLAELHDRFVANVEQIGHDEVVAVGDVVVPPLYGAQALTVHVAGGVAVRALGLCAGHNQFVPATPRVMARVTRQLTAA